MHYWRSQRRVVLTKRILEIVHVLSISDLLSYLGASTGSSNSSTRTFVDMPLWQIHHHPDAFTAEQKQGLSQAITKIYTDVVGLPAFYAIVIFDANENIFVGGRLDPKFVRITFTQLARFYPEEEEHARGFQQLVDAALKPWIADQGLSWEYNYVFEPRLYWKINGLVPPSANSDEEKLWKQENKPIPY